MSAVADIADFLERFAPLRLAEDWDNVGLLVGDRGRTVRRLMTCLTITPDSAAEAIAERAELIVAHHPLPFLALKRLTADTTVGRVLLELAAARVAVYSPHTAFDSARDGINERLAAGLGLGDVVPLALHCETDLAAENLGAGRCGRLAAPMSLDRLADRLRQFLNIKRLQSVGRPERLVQTVAVACGAADELLDAARRRGCDVLVIGEARFHTCLEAQALNIALLLPGHFASERFAVERLAEVLKRQFPDVHVWCSQRESDPIELF